MRFGGAVTQVEFTRDTLEELTADLLERTVAVTRRTIATARSQGRHPLRQRAPGGRHDPDAAVAQALTDRLGLDARHHEPDLAVAKGAALFALHPDDPARQAASRPGSDRPEVAARPG